MTTKNVTVGYCLRDPQTQEINTDFETTGTTEDEGITCTLPIGYLPAITEALPSDVRVRVHQPVVELSVAEVVSVTPDEIAGTQTMVFELI
jgi:hypothetical protein